MEIILQIYDTLLLKYTLPGMLLITALVVLFFIQLWYYVRCYGRIPSYRNSGKSGEGLFLPVSVIVVLQDNFQYLEEALPQLLNQDYPDFEVVVVDLASEEEFSDALLKLRERYPHLATTRIEHDLRFPVSYKMVLNVGIKAARFERVVITSANACPVSNRWLSLMARGFTCGDVVLGYAGMEQKPGIVNKMIRCSRLMMSIRYLASAIRGVPYRGILENIGYTKTLYFNNKGFNYLNMNVGEDDLFIQAIATRHNTAVVMNPKATMRQWQWSGIGWWRSMRRFHSYTYRYYPRRVKNSIEWELGSRFLFFAATATAIGCLPAEIKFGAAGLLLFRLFIVEFEIRRIGKRLGENDLGWIWVWYDLIAPVSEFFLWLRRNINPNSGLWR